jgi:hypothetical protein
VVRQFRFRKNDQQDKEAKPQTPATKPTEVKP